MTTVISLVESELGRPYARLIADAITLLAKDRGEHCSEPEVINYLWKAKHLIDVNQHVLFSHSATRQQQIVKRYLAGDSVVEWLE
jgi:hypothetical protein